MREVIRPCADCGKRCTFKVRRHVPHDLALLCTECRGLRAARIVAERSRKQNLRKPTQRRPRT